MSDIINSAQNFQLSIKNDADLEKISNIGSALSSIDKLKILQLLSIKCCITAPATADNNIFAVSDRLLIIIIWFAAILLSINFTY